MPCNFNQTVSYDSVNGDGVSELTEIFWLRSVGFGQLLMKFESTCVPKATLKSEKSRLDVMALSKKAVAAGPDSGAPSVYSNNTILITSKTFPRRACFTE